MDYKTWCDEAHDRLVKARGPYLLGDFEDQAILDSYSSGDSPVVFVQKCANGQISLKPRDAGLGACPQCGSRDLRDVVVKEEKTTLRVIIIVATAFFSVIALVALPCLVIVPLILGAIMYFASMDRNLGQTRTCRVCGYGWKIV